MSQPLTQETKAKLLERLNEVIAALTNLAGFLDVPNNPLNAIDILASGKKAINEFIHTLPGILIGVNNKILPFYLIYEIFIDLDHSSSCLDTEAGATGAVGIPDPKKVLRCINQLTEARYNIEQLMSEPWQAGDYRFDILRSIKELIDKQLFRGKRVHEGELPEVVNMGNNGEFFAYLILRKKLEFLSQIENIEKVDKVYVFTGFIVESLKSIDEFLRTEENEFAKREISSAIQLLTNLKQRVENSNAQ